MNKFLYSKVIEWITENSKVLDLGTGDGNFLYELIQTKKIYGEAVEKNPELLAKCIEKGLVAYQGDILDGLDQYGDKSFDYILLLGTFQELVAPETVLRHSFRVGKKVILAFTNFAYYKARYQMMFKGKRPALNSEKELLWYESPTIQFFSLTDFLDFCEIKKISKLKSAYFNSSGRIKFLPNWRASEVLVLIEWEVYNK